MRKPVSGRQYLDAEVLVVKFDNSSTPSVSRGGNQVTVTRGTGTGTRDRITITFKKPIFGLTPDWVGRSDTANTTWKDVAGTSSKTAIVIDSLNTTNGASVTDASGTIFIYGNTASPKEGNY